jgi:hypothetical protein
MDVDEMLAGLSEADRKALLRRLMLEVSPEEDEVEMEERVARLEQRIAAGSALRNRALDGWVNGSAGVRSWQRRTGR